jgi:sulfur-carrier protein
MPEIRIPPVLRPETRGYRSVNVEGATVREALDALVCEYPALDGRVRSGNTVPSFLNVFVNGEDIRLLDGLETAVGKSATILLLPAVAGGSTRSRVTDTSLDTNSNAAPDGPSSKSGIVRAA